MNQPAAKALHILALNCGSSSLKFGLYRVLGEQVSMLISGQAEEVGAVNSASRFTASDAQDTKLLDEQIHLPTQRDAMTRIADFLTDQIESGIPAPDVIGHRVVHGGAQLRQHCLMDDEVLQKLNASIDFAPLHTPAALEVIDFAREHFPTLPQVCCFDTSFHSAMPDVARILPIASELLAEGVQRYGFHGLSCESILQQLASELPQVSDKKAPPASQIHPHLPHRIIIAHLGNGSSITAIKDGISIDTSMGLTPSGGVMMGTRSGDLDPGVLGYLMRVKQLDATAIEHLVDRQSGLLGVSGISSDMRQLHVAANDGSDAEAQKNAQLAIAMFCYSVAKQIASMITALNGVDLIVFTGGIGEHDPKIRADICKRLDWIGIAIDETRNRERRNPIDSDESRCSVQVLTSQEDEQIARHAWAIVQAL